MKLATSVQISIISPIALLARSDCFLSTVCVSFLNVKAALFTNDES
jgi:hypothetical protein